MNTVSHPRGNVGQLRHSAWDALFVGLALLHGVVIVLVPHPLVIGVGLWWNSNTISHGFIHNPFFRSRSLNQLFAAYLTMLLGFPHAIWRARHLAHHAENRVRLRFSIELMAQVCLVTALWLTLLLIAPAFFLWAYLPGFGIGLVLCALHGHYEHANGTASFYGRIYNWLFFRDGYHVEHHASPKQHWTRLEHDSRPTQVSRWPPVLRWLEVLSLETLERLVLRMPLLQRWVLRCHRRAFAHLLQDQSGIERVGIVGGGLFPRTAIILRELLPQARITVIDLNQQHLDICQRLLPADVESCQSTFEASDPAPFDLLVIPLSLQGERDTVYSKPNARIVCVHDWIWRKRGSSQIVSLALLKRLNMVEQHERVPSDKLVSTTGI